ncbi:unnamed protein product [Cylindrotheca closterium]|uniref:Uncharacterized protein n=1 Tax=Cylindrotheca closterium TaxID=2856 RepID=A0AAD2JIU1_9STRA|nr:unnamed protein product [Cylindrotheca closterium]
MSSSGITKCLPQSKVDGYFNTWHIFWVGIPATVTEHFVSAELSSFWRRHLIWSKPAGKLLREALTQRFASTTVFLSLILGTEIRVLFSPSTPADNVRNALKNEESHTLEYWTGIGLCLSIFFSIAALVANFTAWGIYTVIGNENLKLIARSSIGLYGAQLPNILVVGVIYLFYTWVALFWWIIMPIGPAVILSVGGILLIVHIVSTYSALARIIMDTGAMSSKRVLDQELEDDMTPQELAEELLKRTREARVNSVPVNLKYREINKQYIANAISRSKRTNESEEFGVGGGLSIDEIADVDLAD